MLNPDWARRQREQQQRHEREIFDRAVDAGEVIAWDEMKIKWQKRMFIDGNTFKPELNRPEAPVIKPGEKDEKKKWIYSPEEKWAYANRTYPAGKALETAQGPKNCGKVWFTTDIVLPTLLHAENPAYSSRGIPWEIMMSYTPMEILTLRPGVRQAKGKVLIGGLGLGVFLRMVAAKKSVTEIVVVESCQDLLNFLGNEIVEKERERSGKPITLICDDVYDHVGKHGDDTRHLLDIWPSFGNYPGLRFEKLRKEGHHMWGWGIFQSL